MALGSWSVSPRPLGREGPRGKGWWSRDRGSLLPTGGRRVAESVACGRDEVVECPPPPCSCARVGEEGCLVVLSRHPRSRWTTPSPRPHSPPSPFAVAPLPPSPLLWASTPPVPFAVGIMAFNFAAPPLSPSPSPHPVTLDPPPVEEWSGGPWGSRHLGHAPRRPCPRRVGLPLGTGSCGHRCPVVGIRCGHPRQLGLPSSSRGWASMPFGLGRPMPSPLGRRGHSDALPFGRVVGPWSSRGHRCPSVWAGPDALPPRSSWARHRCPPFRSSWAGHRCPQSSVGIDALRSGPARCPPPSVVVGGNRDPPSVGRNRCPQGGDPPSVVWAPASSCGHVDIDALSVVVGILGRHGHRPPPRSSSASSLGIDALSHLRSPVRGRPSSPFPRLVVAPPLRALAPPIVHCLGLACCGWA